MRIWWFTLAIIFGLLVGVVVWLAPQRPSWSKALTSNISWSSIKPWGDRLTAISIPDKNGPRTDRFRILVLDTKTGELQKEVELPIGGPLMNIPQVAPDLCSVFVEDNFRQVDQGGRKVNLRDWSIYDLATGQRRYGPQSDSFLGGRPWSPDGQWFCTTRRQPGRLEDHLQVRSLQSGKVIHEFPTPEGYHQAMPLFSPNSASMCIFWEELQSDGTIRADARKLISIHELPSGQEIKAIELPKNRLWNNVRNWDGETLMILELIQGSKHESESAKCLLLKPFQSTSFEKATTDSILGALETERSNEQERLAEWRFGADWAVGWKMVKLGDGMGKWYDQLRQWIINRLKFDISGRTKWRVNCYSRKDGQLRLEFPDFTAMPINVGEDGRLLYANRQEEQQGPWTLEAWDLYPSPRWPWSLLAGLGTTAFLLLPEYWRIRRKRQKAVE
jgi:hypothetical protein